MDNMDLNNLGNQLITTDGEIIDIESLKVALINGVIKAQNRQKDGYKKALRKKKTRDGRAFAKVARAISEQNDDLKGADLGVLLNLMQHIYYERGGLLMNSSCRGRRELDPMTIKDIMNVAGKSRRGIDQIIARLEEKDIVIVDRTNKTAKYYLNEKYIACGKGDMEDDYVMVYKTHTKRIMDRLADAEKGIIFKLLPYIHMESCLLVENPSERDLTKIEPLTMSRIAEVTGLSRKSITNRLKTMINAGAIARIECSGTAYSINPRVACRIPSEDVPSDIMMQFDILESKVQN